MNSKKILCFGVFLGGLCLVLDRFFGLPESIYMFGLGIACTVDVFGLYVLHHDKDMRENCLLKRIFHRS